MEDNWLAMAKRLQAIAETGISYSPEPFEVERYEEIADIACRMLEQLSSTPIDTIKGLVDEGATGYRTPKVDVRGAVFHEEKVLLVREKSDGLWTLPGGFADIGLSPAENVEKEVLEEACIAVDASLLYSIRHKAKGEYPPDVRDFYKLFFLCTPKGSHAVQAGPETSAAQYFALDDLPPLSTGRVVTSDIEAAKRYRANSRLPTYFD